MLKKRKNQVLYRLRTQTFRYAEISQDSSIENRHTVPEFGEAEFWSFGLRHYYNTRLYRRQSSHVDRAKRVETSWGRRRPMRFSQDAGAT